MNSAMFVVLVDNAVRCCSVVLDFNKLCAGEARGVMRV